MAPGVPGAMGVSMGRIGKHRYNDYLCMLANCWAEKGQALRGG